MVFETIRKLLADQLDIDEEDDEEEDPFFGGLPL